MLSPESARRAEVLGYSNVKIFHDGMPAWEKASKPVVSESSNLKEMIEKDISHVLVDLRTAESASRGFIPGAVSVPSAELGVSKDRFPSDLSAPIILYSDENTEEAFNTVRGWGYKDTSVLNGGTEAWEKAGGTLASGELGAEIVYVYKPRPGEIMIEEFKNIVETGAADRLVLDVREPDEAMNGMLKGALNIPIGRIAERSAEIPKDKEVIAHCVTGIRAEMAYDELKKLGYKVRFLNAVIQVDKDGKYEITKK